MIIDTGLVLTALFVIIVIWLLALTDRDLHYSHRVGVLMVSLGIIWLSLLPIYFNPDPIVTESKYYLSNLDNLSTQLNRPIYAQKIGNSYRYVLRFKHYTVEEILNTKPLDTKQSVKVKTGNYTPHLVVSRYTTPRRGYVKLGILCFKSKQNKLWTILPPKSNSYTLYLPKGGLKYN